MISSTPPQTTPNESPTHLLIEKINQLSPSQQQEVLTFIEFLQHKSQPKKTIWDKIEEIIKNVPDEEWEKLPTDGALEHDHYLYGTPKKILMNIVFIDALYWIALINPRDQWHSSAVEAQALYSSAKFVTTEAVLIEVLNYFSSYGARFRLMSSQITRAILDDSDIEVLSVTSTLFLSGLTLYEQRLDKGYSMVDCISMAMMKNRDLAEVLTHDKHFSQESLEYFYDFGERIIMAVFKTTKLDTVLKERVLQLEQERKSLLDKTLKWLDLYASEYGIDRAYIFGSVTRPYQFKSNSDIDLAVENIDTEHHFTAISLLSEHLGREVDIIKFDNCHFFNCIRDTGVPWTKTK